MMLSKNPELMNYSNSKLFELLMQNESPISIALLTPDLVFARVNKTLCNLVGKEEKDIVGKHCYDLIGINRNNTNLKDSEKICEYCVSLQAIKYGKNTEMIQEISREFVAHTLAYPLKNSKGETIGVMKIIENIADKINDPLTRIKNYRFFEESLSQECYRASRLNLTSSVTILDLDNFKFVNDIYGHSYGDKVLKKVANTLHIALRKSDKLCRIGGDEFGIILSDTPEEDCKIVVQRLKILIEETFKNYDLSFCYGIVSMPKDGNDPKVIREKADSKLYEQKDARKNKNISFISKKVFNTYHAT